MNQKEFERYKAETLKKWRGAARALARLEEKAIGPCAFCKRECPTHPCLECPCARVPGSGKPLCTDGGHGGLYQGIAVDIGELGLKVGEMLEGLAQMEYLPEEGGGG